MSTQDFKIWLNNVEIEVQKATGFNLDDLTDEDYWENFSKGKSVAYMVNIVLVNLDGYMKLLGINSNN
jgi:hypothetical protein